MAQFQKPVPAHLRIVGILSIIWMVFGCLSYLYDVTLSPEQLAALPADQVAVMQATPSWIYALFAIATWGGLIGAVLLFLKKRAAVLLLLISWVAALAQFGGLFLTVPKAAATGTVIPALIISLGIAFWWYARKADKEGWLG